MVSVNERDIGGGEADGELEAQYVSYPPTPSSSFDPNKKKAKATKKEKESERQILRLQAEKEAAQVEGHCYIRTGSRFRKEKITP